MNFFVISNVCEKSHLSGESIFVVNDSFGNSSIIFQNGAQKIATFINGNLSPEKVISKMKIISVNLEELNLLIDGDTHTYVKLN